ncbi:hypothetical protein KOW79_001338 [Hemibagrus wyckioides]|uniref:Uncharacterized protein n=1 Tax=Hemibagrus wyckioides TaxID=337641 RepID=A0A9D3P970_9TELE|nr:hypothetical protein KOW79_001338 [Hemibagrus wyckioides]
MKQKIIFDEVSNHRQIGFDGLDSHAHVGEEALRNTHTDMAPPKQVQMPTSHRRAFHSDILPTPDDIRSSRQSRMQQMLLFTALLSTACTPEERATSIMNGASSSRGIYSPLKDSFNALHGAPQDSIMRFDLKAFSSLGIVKDGDVSKYLTPTENGRRNQTRGSAEISA